MLSRLGRLRFFPFLPPLLCMTTAPSFALSFALPLPPTLPARISCNTFQNGMISVPACRAESELSNDAQMKAIRGGYH